MVYDKPPNDAGQHERDLRAPKSPKCRSRPNSVIVPNPGSRRPTPTGGSVSPSSTSGSARSSPRSPQRAQRGLLRPGPNPDLVPGARRTPRYQPLVRPETRQQAGRGVAAVAHFSVFFFWLFGPGLVYALSTRDVRAQEAAVVQLPVDLFDRVRAGRHSGRNGQLDSRLVAAVHGSRLVGPHHLRRCQGSAGGGLEEPGQERDQARGAVGEVARKDGAGSQRSGAFALRPGINRAAPAYTLGRICPVAIDRPYERSPQHNSIGGDRFRLGSIVPGEAGREAKVNS